MDGLIRIVGIQRSETPSSEFVLLQNQGSRRVSLRGHAVLSDAALSTGDLSVGAHCFTEDEQIGSGMYVMLVTGCGENRWGRTRDGATIYVSHMNRTKPIWQNFPGPLHVLAPQHTYSDRSVEHLLMR